MAAAARSAVVLVCVSSACRLRRRQDSDGEQAYIAVRGARSPLLNATLNAARQAPHHQTHAVIAWNSVGDDYMYRRPASEVSSLLHPYHVANYHHRLLHARIIDSDRYSLAQAMSICTAVRRATWSFPRDAPGLVKTVPRCPQDANDALRTRPLSRGSHVVKTCAVVRTKRQLRR
ncbi:hypothetical protein BD626DRAFT_515676 [Schizophyllum amplum]|uniref:Uncharacterized protein n=1 Tax=Schizophyllum amplum TaxID=97359 RepID=A0A550BXL6_9AGAR|nr:hypothetical protein BD626DRAFT_515662 [Auriculariopsis ampla]TRM57285.1 hypothetical protein BD626DRAFT_515676 [Auriculariopsis ampla]